MIEDISVLVARLSDEDGLVRQNARLDLQTIGKHAVAAVMLDNE